MTTFLRASNEALARAEALRKQFQVRREERRATAEGGTVELPVTVRNPIFDWLSLGFEIDGNFAGENNEMVRSPERSIGNLVVPIGEANWEIQVTSPTWFHAFNGRVSIPPKPDGLIVEVWHALYPPRLLLGEDWLNRPPGLRYESRRRTDCPGPGPYPLLIIDREGPRPEVHLLPADRKLLLQEYDLWIDGARIFPRRREPYQVDADVLHRAEVSLGVHHIRVGDPTSRRLLLDTEVLVDGANLVSIEISRRTGVVLREGGTIVLQTDDGERPLSRSGVAYQDRLLTERKVDGVPIPYGAEGYLDEIETEIEFKKAMAANYKAFKEKKQAVNKKKAAGQALTEDEQLIDLVTDLDALDKWIAARKKTNHGWTLEKAAGTGPDAKAKWLGPPPATLMDELRKSEALMIHEPSHVQDVEVLALALGVDLNKLRQLEEIWRKQKLLEDWAAEAKKAQEKGQPLPPAPEIDLTEEERELLMWWYPNHKKDIERFYKAFNDPLAACDGEIREYTAGADFYQSVLGYLSRHGFGWVVTDMALKMAVGKSKDITVSQMPDAPPRVRVIEGANHVDVSPTVHQHSNPGVGGTFKIPVKGKSKGTAKIELTCGNLRKVVVVVID